MSFDERTSLLSRVYADVLDWEKSAGIFDYCVDDVPVWRLVRNQTVVAHTVREGAEQPHKSQTFSAKGVAAAAAGAIKSFCQLALLPDADVLFWGSSRRLRNVEGWLDPLTDPLVQCLSERRSVSLERPLQGRHRSPPLTKQLKWYDGPKVLARIRARLPARLSQAERRVVSDLSDLISGRFGVARQRIERRLTAEISAFRAERGAARFMLERTNPSAVFVVNRWINSGVLAACSQHAIPSYEIQHGAVGHEGFKYHTPYAKGLDPDGFLVFGEEWKSYNWGLSKDAVHNLGAPYIWTARSEISDGTRGAKIMLVSQPNQAEDLNESFKAICLSLPDESFILQLHPQDRGNWQERYTVGKLPNVAVAKEGQPLYQSFADCKAVIGQDSTVLYEASFFNLKVGLLNLPNTLKSSVRSRIGTYNFFDAQSVELVKDMLVSPRCDEAVEGNGYFDAFQEKTLRRLPGLS